MSLHSKVELCRRKDFCYHTYPSRLSLFLLLSSDSVQKTHGKNLTELPEFSAPSTVKCSLAKKERIGEWWSTESTNHHQANSG